jgi:glyoxylase-like metal-dependent hydrolase (beta-lactamase superfamily II)
MKVHCFSTGRVREKRGARGVRRYLPGGWRTDTRPVNVFAVEHPDGVCLFDTGQTALATRPGYFARWYPFFRLARFELGPDDEAAAQLRRRGIDPAEVRWVVMSHLHTDHAGGLSAFVRATLVVSRVEWRRAQGLGGRLRGYVPLSWPSGGPVVFAEERRDLAGDGSLQVLPTPGHTPGHVSLLVRDGSRVLLLGGDADPFDDAIAALCVREGATFLGTHADDACDEVSR